MTKLNCFSINVIIEKLELEYNFIPRYNTMADRNGRLLMELLSVKVGLVVGADSFSFTRISTLSFHISRFVARIVLLDLTCRSFRDVSIKVWSKSQPQTTQVG